MTGLLIVLALIPAITLAALIGDRVRELRATVDLLLIPEDAADDRAQQAAMSDDEIVRMREWQDIVAATDGTDSPLYGATAAHILRHQLEDPAAVDRFLGGAS